MCLARSTPATARNKKWMLIGFMIMTQTNMSVYPQLTNWPKRKEMTTATYQALTEQEKREVRMFGVTEAGMREAVESSSTFKFSGPAMVAASMLSDAQEMVSYGPYDGDTLANILEDQRQLLNRAKFVLFEYLPARR
jgi:hypothetical protein